jgi:hypothetical protein
MMKSYALGLATAAVLSLAAPAFAADAKAAPAPGPTPAAASPAPLQIQRFADGTLFVSLGTSFLNISMAQRQPDGSIREICVDSAAAANAILTAAPAFEDK